MWTRSDMTAIMSLLLIAAIWLGWASGKPRIEFADQPPTHAWRVSAATERIDPNTASEASMLRLRGIGPVKVRNIIEHRDARGPDAFKTAADLTDVKGIGPVTIRRISQELALPQ